MSVPTDRWQTVRDGTNLVVFRDEAWCYNGQCGHLTTYPRRAIAMTTVYPEGARGAVVQEADVELNGMAYGFTLPGQQDGNGEYEASPGPNAKRHVPLTNVLVHEIGHVLGFEDACIERTRPSGKPVMGHCSASERASAMYPAMPSDHPTDRDLRALCTLYPSQASGRAAEPGASERSAGSCAYGAQHGAGPLTLAAAAAFVLAVRRTTPRRIRARARSRATTAYVHVRHSGERRI